LEQAAQGSGGVAIPGGVQKMCRCGTWGHGLAGMVVLGWWMDLLILEVFSSLNDSVIYALLVFPCFLQNWDNSFVLKVLHQLYKTLILQQPYLCNALYRLDRLPA